MCHTTACSAPNQPSTLCRKDSLGTQVLHQQGEVGSSTGCYAHSVCSRLGCKSCMIGTGWANSHPGCRNRGLIFGRECNVAKSVLVYRVIQRVLIVCVTYDKSIVPDNAKQLTCLAAILYTWSFPPTKDASSQHVLATCWLNSLHFCTMIKSGLASQT